MASCLFKCIKWLIILTIVVLLLHFWITNKAYMIDEKELGEIVAKNKVSSPTGDPTESFKRIYKALRARYPGHILPEKDLEWVFLSTGGWMGSIQILHGTFTEYIMFFGMGLDTMGHTGRYWANVTDYIVAGEMKILHEGGIKVSTYKAGDTVKSVWGTAGAVRMKEGTWMVEYGRGVIPSTLSPALAQIFFNNQDFYTLFYMFRVYAKAVILELSTALGVAL